MATTRAARNQKAYRDRARVKRLRDEAAFDQVLGAMVVTPVQTPDGWEVSITLPKTCPEYAIFERLADILGRTPVQLFGELTRGAIKRYMAGECG